MSFEAHNLTVPAIRWLGLLPSDIKRLDGIAEWGHLNGDSLWDVAVSHYKKKLLMLFIYIVHYDSGLYNYELNSPEFLFLPLKYLTNKFG